VIKPVIQLSTNASYVDIGEFFAKGMKNRIRRASRHQSSFHFTPIHFYRKSFFFRASWIADYPDAEIIYPYFTVKLLSDGPNYTHFKMIRSIYDQAFKKLMTKTFYFVPENGSNYY
jgi:peptide/nickel transport system substrate-binding protein